MNTIYLNPRLLSVSLRTIVSNASSQERIALFDATPSLSDRWCAFGGAMALATLMFFGICLFVNRKHRHAPAKLAQAMTVCWWVVGCFMVAATCGVVFGTDRRYLLTYSGFGLVVGTILGNVRGAMVVNDFPTALPEPEPDSLFIEPLNSNADYHNPYEPPPSSGKGHSPSSGKGHSRQE
jgi:hypothetical protein